VKTPWFAVCLHWIDKPDPEPYLHDHPVSFLSIILQGSYWEERVTKDASPRFYHRRWFNLVRASAADRHSIVKVDPDTLTLALMGPKVREWGFHDGPSWTLWKDYYTAKRKA
jgi:hypothetical protein